MGFKQLVTLRGNAPYDDEEYSFDVLEGGALRIRGKGEDGTVDLIGPGFWIAVVDERSRDRLTWDFLAPPESDND